VGKTTVAAGLCLALVERGYEVLALDCDPDSNFGNALGFPEDVLASIRPLSSLADLIEERTGARPGGYGGMFKLNPHVADIPDTHCYRHGRIRLLAMDTVERGGGGCACPQNVLVKRVVDEVLVRRNEAVVMDMEAGLEHLGRATAKSVSCLLVVVEPGRRSVATAQAVLALAADIELARCFVVGNRFKPLDGFPEFLQPHFDENRILGCVPFDERIVQADRMGTGIQEMMAPATHEAFSHLLDRIEEASV
jgi:CO dehydrogenase maturation factor